MNLEDFFERIELHYKQSLPFVVYRMPNSDIVKVFLQNDDTLYAVKDYTESGFVMAPFNITETVVFIPLKHSETITVVSKPSGTPIKNSKASIEEDPNAKAFHIELVTKGIDAIKQGDLQKVVLSRRELQALEVANPIEIFKRLSANYSSAFAYCFYHPKVGIWLGATPETLLKIDGHRLFTTALAATQPYKGTMEVEWNPKEREEHELVSNFIIDHLRDSTSHLTLGEVETVKAGKLLHLRTNISGSLNNQQPHIQHILNTLHPTPAVCGVPKKNAKEFILAHEGYDREFYTGFLGELNQKERKFRATNRHNAENDAFAAPITVTNLFVNLRCMQLKSDQAIIYVGGGITKASKPEDEWEETVIKAQTIKSVL